ncbi:VOC family protein [Tsukamurella pseudospumae]|uniref:Bleomycin resistance protein n=1 Tax=Tsukamurella pseudospumae TaxID=239498 RepID=A0A137ZZF1_9ACTN|nr:VOC family protein [Tsukamurella pseudospumae]KXO89321.1 bleomycin resistance protein [Tsukamurella pseudospumae]KXP03555.1 bleomycin resistance protein [Tsukamurella pseudospumae]
MSIALNHTIVAASDNFETARFLTEVLGLEAPVDVEGGHFQQVRLANEVALDVMTVPGPIHPQHYAFLVSEPEFDEIFARIRERGLAFHAHPDGSGVGEINHRFGGRGVYFPSPDGHALEALTAV